MHPCTAGCKDATGEPLFKFVLVKYRAPNSDKCSCNSHCTTCHLRASIPENSIQLSSSLLMQTGTNLRQAVLEIYKLNKIRMSSDINTAIEGILTRRNVYIHTGAVDYDKHFNDFFLLHELIEIWILTLLDCPDTAISRRAFRHIIL